MVYPPKDIRAADASTGEQKALLIGLVLAHAGLLAEMTGFAPILLLDEVAAHLDPDRRAALYEELDRLGAQVWMTGADPAAFADVASRAAVFTVSPGRVERPQLIATTTPSQWSGDTLRRGANSGARGGRIEACRRSISRRIFDPRTL